MRSKLLFAAAIFAMAVYSCGTVQSIVKSSLPYTVTLIIPASADTTAEQSVTGNATSLDQSFTKTGNNARKVSGVHIISARLMATDPSRFTISNLKSVKIYVSQPDGNVELPVASQTNIPANADNNIALEIDNSHFLDELVRQKTIKVRMIYSLRKGVSAPAALKVALGLTAYPAGRIKD